MNLPVEVIADHLGGLKGISKLNVNSSSHTDNSTAKDTVLEQPGFRSLVQLAKNSRVAIKISGLYRSSTSVATGYDDLAPIVRALAEQVPDRLVWASDWPHTGEGKDRKPDHALSTKEPFRVIDNMRILKNLKDWVGNDETWYKLTVLNPRALYK